MATFTLNLGATLTPASGAPVSYSPTGTTYTPAGDGHQKGRFQTNATAGTDNAIPFGTVTIAAGMRMILRNLSLTDSMDVSSNTGGSFAANIRDTIPPGDCCYLHPGSQYYIKCAAASQPYEVLLQQA